MKRTYKTIVRFNENGETLRLKLIAFFKALLKRPGSY